MSSNPPNRFARQIVPAVALLAMVLCFAVFAWGLHYKLSLYKTAAEASAHEPAAKLLNDHERLGAHAQAALPTGPAVFLLLPLLLFLFLPGLIQARWQMILAKAWTGSRSCRVSGPLFRRPPPALFFA